MKDEVLTELWKVKDRISKESDYNSQKLYERLKKVERSLDRPVVNRTKQRNKQFA